MSRRAGPAVAALLAVAAAVLPGAGCEQIVPWQAGGGDGGDAGDGGGNLGDGGSGAFLASFGPGGQLLRAPADGGSTSPTALAVTILRGGESGPVQIDVTSSDASVASVAGNAVVVPAGQTSVTVPVSSWAGGTATLTATFDGGVLQASVQVLPTVVISEVAAETAASTGDEFVELYDPTPVGFSLAGYAVQYHSSNGGTNYLNVVTLGPAASIAPHGFYLIGVDSYARAEDVHSSWSGAAFSASAGSVRLGAPGIGVSSQESLAVDTVGWGTGSVSFEGTGPVDTSQLVTWGSIERKAKADSTTAKMALGGSDYDAGNAYDTNDNAADFVIKLTQEPQTSGSPTETPP